MRLFLLLLLSLLLLTSAAQLSAQTLTPKREGEKIGFFRGDSMVRDYVYDETSTEIDSVFAVRQGDRWGVLSNTGEVLIPCKYDKLRFNHIGSGFTVSDDGRWGAVDKQGRVLLPLAFANADRYYRDSFALVKQDSVWGYLLLPGQRFVSDTALLFHHPEQRARFTDCADAGPTVEEKSRCASAAMARFVATRIRYPQRAISNDVQGRVLIGLTIQADGKSTDAGVVRGIGSGCDEEALRVVGEMPNWVPGIQDGQPVATRMLLPVTFKLE